MGLVLPPKARHDEATMPTMASPPGYDDGDQLSPARGIVLGLALGLIFFTVVGGLFWLLRL
jgi:hypothetical protein